MIFRFIKEGLRSAGQESVRPGVFSVPAARVRNLLLGAVAVFFMLDILYLYLRFGRGQEKGLSRQLYDFFSLRQEFTLPALFSALLLLLAGALLYVVAETRPAGSSRRRPWKFLSGIFLLLCLDEAFSVHEKLSAPVNRWLTGDVYGLLRFSWVVPYSVLLLGLGLYYFRFLQRLPKRTRYAFYISGALYVSGSLGLELVEGYAFTEGQELLFMVLGTVEETMEMTGIILFLSALMHYLSPATGTLVLSSADGWQETAAPGLPLNKITSQQTALPCTNNPIEDADQCPSTYEKRRF
ncbi:MAG TPA: hypothetical protein VHK69_19515 [Chitinophagaceae bacterium]|jgi:hypothetical protein|nr:hypothetical protein [Chitinophagaceae bacterium]